jgi:hypothetical protein
LALTGTITATGSNVVTFTNAVGTGTANLQSFFPPALGTVAINNPVTIPIDGGTCTVIVTSASGTFTNTGYVFQTGPLGGIQLNPGDLFIIGKGTDTIASYAVSIEATFTPGTNLTI